MLLILLRHKLFTLSHWIQLRVVKRFNSFHASLLRCDSLDPGLWTSPTSRVASRAPWPRCPLSSSAGGQRSGSSREEATRPNPKYSQLLQTNHREKNRYGSLTEDRLLIVTLVSTTRGRHRLVPSTIYKWWDDQRKQGHFKVTNCCF